MRKLPNYIHFFRGDGGKDSVTIWNELPARESKYIFPFENMKDRKNFKNHGAE